MGFLSSLFGGGGSKSSTSATTNNTDSRIGVGGDSAAPIAGQGAGQANGSGSIAGGRDVKVSQTDSRNLGNQISKVGNNSEVNIMTSDPLVSLGAIESATNTAAYALAANVQAQQDALAVARSAGEGAIGLAGELASRNQGVTYAAFDLADELAARGQQTTADALAANLAAQREAYATVRATNADAFDLSGDAVGLARDLAEKNDRATTNTINAALDQARSAAADSRSVVENALGKLADQRAPDGANLTKVALYIGLALVAAFALRPFLSRSK